MTKPDVVHIFVISSKHYKSMKKRLFGVDSCNVWLEPSLKEIFAKTGCVHVFHETIKSTLLSLMLDPAVLVKPTYSGK